MQRCLGLAEQGLGRVAPNPMVGAVLVYEGRIVAEGYHEVYGGPHAEVNAIAHLQDQSLLENCTLYVNLEPCAHHGKTPPCADLVIEKKIPRVIIGSLDTNPLVAGKGIAKLEAAGIHVEHGILGEACRELNKRFFTFHEQQRPYIILKWAETADGFISRLPLPADKADNWITGEDSRKLVHLWRSQEQAIMAGTNTVLADDPQLTTRLVNGKNPLRVIIDRQSRLDGQQAVFNREAETIVFTGAGSKKQEHTRFVQVDLNKPLIPQVLERLYHEKITSLLVEGGAQLLQSFISSGLWDEARIFVNPYKSFGEGIAAPVLDRSHATSRKVGNDILYTLKH